MELWQKSGIFFYQDQAAGLFCQDSGKDHAAGSDLENGKFFKKIRVEGSDNPPGDRRVREKMLAEMF